MGRANDHPGKNRLESGSVFHPSSSDGLSVSLNAERLVYATGDPENSGFAVSVSIACNVPRDISELLLVTIQLLPMVARTPIGTIAMGMGSSAAGESKPPSDRDLDLPEPRGSGEGRGSVWRESSGDSLQRDAVGVVSCDRVGRVRGDRRSTGHPVPYLASTPGCPPLRLSLWQVAGLRSRFGGEPRVCY